MVQEVLQSCLFCVVCLAAAALGSNAGAEGRIDRHALVERHRLVNTQLDEHSPTQVGNGHFAFGADITGLQTFVPFNTLSDWGWHSFPLPPGEALGNFEGELWDTNGRKVAYPSGSPNHKALSDWLYHNPHRFNLGRLGLLLRKADGTAATAADLTDPRQELDLWTGLMHSRFRIEGVPVEVVTCCHPTRDAVAVRVKSPLVASGRISLRLEFPYDDEREFAEHLGDWSKPEAHTTRLTPRGDRSAQFERRMDEARYSVALRWAGGARLSQTAPHFFLLTPGGGDTLEATCAFSPSPIESETPTFATVRSASSRHWPRFWQSGGAIDLSGSGDPRWRELERRIVLSQYLMAVNEAGSQPPQESGLVNNGWNGKFHLEMTWWHDAQYALWDRWDLLNRCLSLYPNLLSSSKQRAQGQGFEGARWPKNIGPEGRESPHPCNANILWQQPHPILFAELDYRAHPTRRTLNRWREVVFATADFLASRAYHNAAKDTYEIGPPIYVVSENTDPRSTLNPAFELSYWRMGLSLAQEWRRRLGLPKEERWDRVLTHLAPLPTQDGLYVLYEGVQGMWTRLNYEHPALVGTYGWLRGDGVDLPTFRRTFDKVLSTWDLNRTWGWDFPVLAMAAARLGEGEKAVDLLLHPSPGFRFDARGLATGGPFPYFPSNGGLLYAVAMMAAGWDGAPNSHAPGFPQNGQWTVRWEGLSTAF
ncbi:MAG TPA: hypothetical protein VGN26_02480 [Armatimonadota bacterium]|jgi:hypothetical protein